MENGKLKLSSSEKLRKNFIIYLLNKYVQYRSVTNTPSSKMFRIYWPTNDGGRTSVINHILLTGDHCLCAAITIMYLGKFEEHVLTTNFPGTSLETRMCVKLFLWKIYFVAYINLPFNIDLQSDQSETYLNKHLLK